jgi:C-terminal processing protease CtpA/Prc
MKLKSLVMVLGALALSAATASNGFAALTSDQRVDDFNQLVDTVLRNYGPLHLKVQTIGLDFNKDVADYKAKVSAAKSDTEFYDLLAGFLSTLQDAHVSSQVPSTYKASLGFTLDRINGKALIDSIDRLKLPEQFFPFQRGDQLISLDNVPVEQIVTQLNLQDNTGNPETSLHIATARLASRKQAAGFEVPTGVTLVTVLPRGAADPVTVTVTWINAGNPIVELDDLSNLSDGTSGAISTAANGNELLAQIKKMPQFNSVMPKSFLDDVAQAGVSDLGSNTSMFKLPDGAQPIDGIPMTAAIYEVAGKKIGILRLPNYEDDGMLEVITRALTELQAKTDVLVLDQTNNPGGSVSLVSDIVGLFAQNSYIDMNFKVRPSLNWIDKIKEINDKIATMLAADPNDVAANALQARFAYLDKEFKTALAQKQFLTRPISLNLTGTFGTIQPNKDVSYTKPVLLLINDLDFSGGDAFPAIMKDNGRVTLFGAKTNGAGGNVAEYGPLVNSFFKFHLTESLMVRPNGNYVENSGVKPDIQYNVTEDDFMNGYHDYVKAFTVAALQLAGANQADIDAYKAKP